MKYAIPATKDSDAGSVTNMSPISALAGLNDPGVYSAAKGTILSLTRAVVDHIEDGVRVNCIAPARRTPRGWRASPPATKTTRMLARR
jgi:meso-butanediol dehydrogenase / (S,S)-butanediol dehydrogenase / diacetyl reductase